ncbi:MAG: hypothetical protein ACFB9M_06810 [Myxococcota bacterium]
MNDVWTRLRARLRPKKRAIPTRPGWFALFAPLVLGTAAVTAGNNLLFILLAATLGVIVLSGIISERVIHDVAVSARPLRPIRAGEEGLLEVQLWRHGSGEPVFGVEVLEISGINLFGRVPKGMLHAHFPVLARSASATSSRIFARRGRLILGQCEVVTTHPFGLLRKAKDVEVTPTGTIWPARVDLPIELLRTHGARAEGLASQARGYGTDLYGLRERRGREVGRVHALRSARLGRDVLIETTAEQAPVAWVGIVAHECSDPEALDRCCELAAAWLWARHETGGAVGLVTPDGAFGPEAIERLMDLLALLQPVKGRAVARTEVDALWLVPGPGGPTRAGDIAVDPQGRIQVTGKAA